MKKLAALLGVLTALWTAPVLAQSPVSPATTLSDIALQLPTNNRGAITAQTMRNVLGEMISNFMPLGVDKTVNPWRICGWGTSTLCSGLFGTINPASGIVSPSGGTTPGGIAGQLQYNVGGVSLGGVTIGGDATLNPFSGVMTINPGAVDGTKLAANAAVVNLGFNPVSQATRGVANGVATLDSSGFVPTAQLPPAVAGGLAFQGSWNANTNSPALTSSVGTLGQYYFVAVSGTTTLNGVSSWTVGDLLLFSSGIWNKIPGSGGSAVTSVAGLGPGVISGPSLIAALALTAPNIGAGNFPNANFGFGAAVAPDSPVTINVNSGATVAPDAGTALHIVGVDSATTRVEIDAFGNSAVFPGITFRKSGGTRAGKTAVLSGDVLVGYGATGWDGSAYGTGSFMLNLAAQNFSASAHGSYFSFFTTPLNSIVSVEAVRFQPSGGLSVGTTTDNGIGTITANAGFYGDGSHITGLPGAFGFYRPESYSGNIANAATAASTAIGGIAGAVRFFGSYTLGASLTLPNGQVWDGSDSGAVPFTYTPTTGSAITLIGDNSALRSAVVTQSGSPTTSIGLQIGNGEQGQHPVARDVTVTGFPTGIDSRSNVLRKLDNVTVNTSGVTGIRTRNTVNPDSGDDFWSGVTISNATGVGTQNVLYEGGGGLKVVGMKSLGSQIGFNVAMPDGASTQDLQYGLSSIENASVACMKLGRSGTTGALGLITITGTEFAGCPYGIWFANAGVSTAFVGGVAMSSIATAGIRIDNGANNIVIGPNVYSTATPIIDNRTDFNEDGYIDRDTVRSFSGITTANHNVYQVVVPSFRSAKLTLFIEGIAQGYAAFGYSAEYILRNNGGNLVATPIYTPVTDPTGPAAVVVTLDVATTAGSVYIGIKSSGGGITQLQGTFTMKLDGKVQQVNQL